MARNYIVESKPALIVNVVDASNFRRNLYLTASKASFPAMIIALNMDTAERQLQDWTRRRYPRQRRSRHCDGGQPPGRGIPELREMCVAVIEGKISAMPRPSP